MVRLQFLLLAVQNLFEVGVEGVNQVELFHAHSIKQLAKEFMGVLLAVVVVLGVLRCHCFEHFYWDYWGFGGFPSIP